MSVNRQQDEEAYMLRMGKISPKSPQEVLEIANSFFGHGGVGLDVLPRGPYTLVFTGGGGFVLIQAVPNQQGTDIDIQSREWDYDARRFLMQI